jgi:hypothetical protein
VKASTSILSNQEFIDNNQFLGCSAIIPKISSYASCDWVFNAGDLGDRAAIEEIQESTKASRHR